MALPHLIGSPIYLTLSLLYTLLLFFQTRFAKPEYMYTHETTIKVSRIEAKLNAAAVEAHGAAWAANWAQGLPNCFEAGGNEKESTGVFVTHMV
jgi:hypothetical protein